MKIGMLQTMIVFLKDNIYRYHGIRTAYKASSWLLLMNVNISTMHETKIKARATLKYSSSIVTILPK